MGTGSGRQCRLCWDQGSGKNLDALLLDWYRGEKLMVLI